MFLYTVTATVKHGSLPVEMSNKRGIQIYETAWHAATAMQQNANTFLQNNLIQEKVKVTHLHIQMGYTSLIDYCVYV